VVWVTASETRREYVPIGSSKTSVFWKVSEAVTHTTLLSNTAILNLSNCKNNCVSNRGVKTVGLTRRL